MKKSTFSNKRKPTLTYIIISVVILVIAIIAIVYFTSNSVGENEPQQGSQVEQEQNKDTEDENTDSGQPEEQSEAPIDSDSKETDEEQVEEDPKEQDGNVNNEDKEPNESETSKVDNGYIVGQTLPTEPTYIDGVLIANKKYPLPKTFNPGENVEARAAFEEMAAAARQAGYELTAFSTFRSFEYQTTLYNRYVERDGKDNADRYSARPGYSEHQTGLAFDIGEVDRQDLWLTSEFGESEAGKWLVANAHLYGFILRYPQGKEDITGYMYESWHFRYLGIPLATKVKESGVTLEEYLGID
ncbi:D-alanyl-D-alanine carboxypeptidase family protein [Ureibacillus sp. MALMAid1270]|uniref:M15 family metallopeptidase n=1 Tax=Ureibacillus sp. MALMAid1270 TaxID=3411629 RepID=UPI003BA55CB4